jgi:cytochrome c oxidase assembly factor CtaG
VLTVSPWSFHPDVPVWVILALLAAAYAHGVHNRGGASRRHIAAAIGALVLALIALSWPLAELAAHTSLTALVVQRALLLLAVPPLVLGAVPPPLMARLTRPAVIDWVLRRCSRPAIAVVIVTLVAVATLTTPAVEAQGSSAWARAGLDLALLAAGFVLWTPVSPRLPGTDRPSALGRAGYLIVQSVVPSFLAIIWIFARHPLYPHFATGPRIFNVSPLLDQQLAGFVAKFATIAVLWTVAFVDLSRAQHALSQGQDPDPLLWSDVERHLERAERRARRRAWLPPRADRSEGRPLDGWDHERPRRREDRA